MLNKSVSLIVLVLMITKYTNGQKVGFGPCPTYVTQTNFNLNRYLGLWFEAEKYPIPSQFAGRCVTAKYSSPGIGRYRVYNQQITYGTNQEDSIYGNLVWVAGAYLEVNLPTFPFYTTSPYVVLETDYVSWSLVWSCNTFLGIYHQEYVWILTRNRHPQPETLEMAYSAMDSRHMNRSYLRRTQQNGCEDYASGQIG